MYDSTNNHIDINYDAYIEYKEHNTLPIAKNITIKEKIPKDQEIGSIIEWNVPGKIIYYIIEKPLPEDESSYQNVWECLSKLKKSSETNKEKSVALTLTKKQLAGLDWKEISEMTKFIFYNSNTQVEILQQTKELAKINIFTENDENWEPIWENEILVREQKKDPFCSTIIDQITKEQAQNYYIDTEGLLYQNDKNNGTDKLVIPKSLIKKVLEDFHDTPLYCHQGQQKTMHSVTQRFYWLTLRNDVINYC